MRPSRAVCPPPLKTRSPGDWHTARHPTAGPIAPTPRPTPCGQNHKYCCRNESNDEKCRCDRGNHNNITIAPPVNAIAVHNAVSGGDDPPADKPCIAIPINATATIDATVRAHAAPRITNHADNIQNETNTTATAAATHCVAVTTAAGAATGSTSALIAEYVVTCSGYTNGVKPDANANTTASPISPIADDTGIGTGPFKTAAASPRRGVSALRAEVMSISLPPPPPPHSTPTRNPSRRAQPTALGGRTCGTLPPRRTTPTPKNAPRYLHSALRNRKRRVYGG